MANTESILTFGTGGMSTSSDTVYHFYSNNYGSGFTAASIIDSKTDSESLLKQTDMSNKIAICVRTEPSGTLHKLHPYVVRQHPSNSDAYEVRLEDKKTWVGFAKSLFISIQNDTQVEALKEIPAMWDAEVVLEGL